MAKVHWLLAAALTVGGTGAQAHTRLASSSPPDGGVLAEGAKEVTLTFDGLMREAACNATDASGKAVTVFGTPKADREKVHVPLTGQLPAGAYAMTCRYKGVDGHEMDTALKFTVEK